MTFDHEQVKALSAALSAAHVKTRKQGGRNVSYIEAWMAISEANRIFGFDGWTSETLELKCVSEKPRTIGEGKRDGWGVSYIAKVRITVGGIIREGVGSGHGIDVDLGLAHESAVKECESDARKRALMTFGNPFGLALYDKEQTNVEHSGTTNGHSKPPPDGSRFVYERLKNTLYNTKTQEEYADWKQRNEADITALTDDYFLTLKEEIKLHRAAFPKPDKPLSQRAAEARDAFNDEIPFP